MALAKTALCLECSRTWRYCVVQKYAKLRLIAKDNYVRNLTILNAVCNLLEFCLYCLASKLLGIFPKLSLPLENLQKSWDGNLRVISEIYPRRYSECFEWLSFGFVFKCVLGCWTCLKIISAIICMSMSLIQMIVHTISEVNFIVLAFFCFIILCVWDFIRWELNFFGVILIVARQFKFVAE